jgi:hypothetical protein
VVGLGLIIAGLGAARLVASHSRSWSRRSPLCSLPGRRWWNGWANHAQAGTRRLASSCAVAVDHTVDTEDDALKPLAVPVVLQADP